MQTFDTLKAETFAGSLLDTLNKSALSLMISVGHRSGLFDTMAEMDFIKDHIEFISENKLSHKSELQSNVVTSYELDREPK